MNWLIEYKKSLKNIEAEELLDVYFYRPLAFIIVKALYSFPITPNQYSLMALISGIFSGYFFYQGTDLGFRLGAFFFLLFAVLDCCDGMVARLKKNGTEFGRLIDGIVDYTVNIIVYFSLGFGVDKYFEGQLVFGIFKPWMLVVMAGVSKAIHSITFDHYLTEYLSYDKGQAGFALSEIEVLKTKYKKAIDDKAMLRAFALKLYIGYTSLQIGNEEKTFHYDPKTYCENNLISLKLWGGIGPAVHIAFLVIAFLFNYPNILYFYAIIFANVWMIFMFVYQFKINSSLKEKKAVA